MVWQWLAMLLAAAVTALLFQRHVGYVTRVRAHSMWPTLRPGQRVFTRSLRHGRRLRHGDVVVLQSAELNRRVVKRVLGLPGDRLLLGPAGLMRNGQPVSEPYVLRRGGGSGCWRVPEGHCFLLGDNRAASRDSRCWNQAFVPLQAIVGRIAVRR